MDKGGVDMGLPLDWQQAHSVTLRILQNQQTQMEELVRVSSGGRGLYYDILIITGAEWET